jgi:hypothetical protein
MKVNHWILLIFSFAGCQVSTPSGEKEIVKGIYGDPRVLTEKGYSLSELGINAIFVHKASLTPALVDRAHKQNIKVYAEFPLLNGKEYLQTDSTAWPIDAQGNRSPQADWFMGICPTHPGFRKYREDQLTAMLATLSVDGVWLDYVHWHAQFETPNPILPETCFCNHCLNNFSAVTHLTLPDGDTKTKAAWILQEHDEAWRKWRSEVIIDWVSDFKTLVHAHNPTLKLGVYYCPWYPHDFNDAEYRILGLDIMQLYKTADVLSPMLYHGRMEREPAWVGQYLGWMDKQIITPGGDGAAIWPIVQASDEPVKISPEEFRNVMMFGASAPATGIMMFSTWAFQKDSLKVEVMEDLYKNVLKKKQETSE